MRGLSNKEIADRLCISVDTVKEHSYNSYKKLSVQNRVQLSYFIQNLQVRRCRPGWQKGTKSDGTARPMRKDPPGSMQVGATRFPMAGSAKP